MQCNIMVCIMEWRGRERWRGEKEREGREEEEGEEGRGGGCIVVEKKGERVCYILGRKCGVQYITTFNVSPSVVSAMTLTVLRRLVCSSWSSWP